MISKKINKVYLLYEKGKYEEALRINEEILKEHPENIYAKRYSSLISSKITVKSKKEIPKIKGKQLKCPSCSSKIGFSGLSIEQREKIKNGDYNNLEIKCPYCHTKFQIQTKKTNSIVGIKVGNTANIDGKKYRITGYAEYFGMWYEGRYRGKLWYLEWILLGEDNSYMYFSEGYSIDEGNKKYEFSLSEKYLPKGKIDTKNYKEYFLVNVRSVYGENSKSYKVGEKIELYDYGDYVLEKEASGTQIEAGFYKQNEVKQKDLKKIFGKNINKVKKYEVTPGETFKMLPRIAFLGFMAFFLSSALFNIIIRPDQIDKRVDSRQVEIGKKYNIRFKNDELGPEKISSTESYDYGGKRTYYEQEVGIKFKIEDNEDIQVLNSIRSEINFNDSELEKKVKNGILYSIK